jgi:hypothetical protein
VRSIRSSARPAKIAANFSYELDTKNGATSGAICLYGALKSVTESYGQMFLRRSTLTFWPEMPKVQKLLIVGLIIAAVLAFGFVADHYNRAVNQLLSTQG